MYSTDTVHGAAKGVPRVIVVVVVYTLQSDKGLI